MKLKKLIKGIASLQIKKPKTSSTPQVKDAKEIEITGMTANSKVVSPGNLFFAKKGRTHDGFQFIPEAVAAGAICVVTELYDPSLSITQLVVDDVKKIEGAMAARYYDYPSDELYMVGVTGTNGKTTTSFFVKYFLDAIGMPSGMIGTVEYVIGAFHYTPTHTTPDLISNHKMLREMCLQGCRAAVMEVTSHALDQQRVDQIHYDAAIYTNLTHEHLDYHKTMDEYAAAKRKLFTSLAEEASAIINVDCPWADAVTRGTKAHKITYGIVHEADLRASEITMDADGTQFSLSWEGEKERVSLPCIGEFNIYNALAAAAVVLSRGVPLSRVIELLASLPRVPGRLEKVPNGQGLSIFVDFAHTEEALRHALQALRPLCRGKLVVVFGCGGDRDQEKRPFMGRVAEKFADHVIVTTDNPRRENFLQILQDITKGMIENRHQVIPDRRQAIEEGLKHLQQGDILLIAGRGHERSQIFANQIIDFHDVAVAEELCRGR